MGKWRIIVMAYIGLLRTWARYGVLFEAGLLLVEGKGNPLPLESEP